MDSEQREPRCHRTRLGKPPRYRMATEALRGYLRAGRWADGGRLPALRTLASELQVSTKTIRRALGILEREGCVYTVRDVGAFVREPHAVKAPGRVTIALAVIDLGGAFEMSIARGVEQACQERRWGLQVFDARGDAERDASNVARLVESGTQGAIVVPISNAANIEAFVKLKLGGYPIGFVDRGVPGLNIDVVESDHEAAAFTATDYLLQQGHSQIFMVTFPPIASSIADRIRGFERAVMARGLEPRRRMMVWADTEVSQRGVHEAKRWLEGYEAVLPVLKAQQPPMAFFALNDYLAWGIYEACRGVGLRIAEDVSVVCVDDSDIAQAIVPAMTVVAQNTEAISRRAVELLERRLRPGGVDLPAQQVRIGCRLIVRESVCRPNASSGA